MNDVKNKPQFIFISIIERTVKTQEYSNILMLASTFFMTLHTISKGFLFLGNNRQSCHFSVIFPEHLKFIFYILTEYYWNQKDFGMRKIITRF